jgi:N-acetylglucosaminyldiphosphoundecaprenol N-acetyl-beta-D-mannosaminyltransferase
MSQAAPLVRVGASAVMPLTESDVAGHVQAAWGRGEGGWIVTLNVDILRAVTHDLALADLISDAEIIVADGMPVVWAAGMSGQPVPERVTGASLVSTLCEAAAVSGRSVYLIGGDNGVPEAAGQALADRFPGLRVVGADSPPFGFDKDEDQVADLVARVAESRADLVLVGLGFPKQEHLIIRLRTALPRAWMLGCGAGIPMAAGQFRRAPQLLQRIGAEWLHRLILEPRRLARRYLINDLPFAIILLAQGLGTRMARRPLRRSPSTASSAASTPPGDATAR